MVLSLIQKQKRSLSMYKVKTERMVKKMNIRINVGKMLKIIIGIAVVGVIVLFFALSSIIDLLLNIQFYQNRLNLDWWTFFTLNNSALLWCPLITVLILMGIVTIFNPLTSSTLTFLYNVTKRRWRPSRRNCVLWNYLVIGLAGGFVMGWIIGYIFEVGFGIFVANYTHISYDFFPTLFTALSYPLNPGIMDINTLFVFTYIIRPFIVLIVVAIIIKMVLDLFNSYSFHPGSQTNATKTTGSIIFIISLIFFIIWLFLPSLAYDVVDSSAALGVVIGFFTCLIIGGIFYVSGVILKEEASTGVHLKQIFAFCLILLILIPMVTFLIAGVKILYRDVNWTPWVWNTKTSTEIANTRIAAGLTNFTTLTTQQLLNNQSKSGIPDEEIISHIRTYDQNASRLSMQNQIGTNWEALADSDIVYINYTEYWIAPRKIRDDPNFALDWVQTHIIYTHSEGFVAVNPVTGEIAQPNSYPSVFGVPSDSPIYFGESPGNYYTILNNTQGFTEIGNITYQGAPDAKLNGFLNWWFIEDWGFKTFDETNYLIKRNINDRVGGILLPHMILGDDPYLVFDGANKRMYYCIDIILDFPSFSGYIQSDIVRWLGVVLIDTALGTMNFYQYNNAYANLPYDFLQIYIDKYNWEPMPSWLIPQLKYPEILIEYQMQIDYTYHVRETTTWRNGNDWFELPLGSDLYYLIYNVGNGTTYVGASTVEFKSASVGNLVGFYIVENGKDPNNLGKVTFYRNGTAGETQMIGLTTAISAYQQKDAQYLRLLITPRPGNYLIYPLANSLYYVIPFYDRTGTFKETLKRVALVNAFNPAIIGIGNNTLQAYQALKVSSPVPPGILSLSVLTSPSNVLVNTYQPKINDLEVLISNGYTTKGFNVSVEIRTESDLFNVSFGGSELKPIKVGQNYTYSLANLTLLPTQYSKLVPQITGRLPAGFVSGTIKYNVALYFANGTFINSRDRMISISL